jgi:hypothetical protein
MKKLHILILVNSLYFLSGTFIHCYQSFGQSTIHVPGKAPASGSAVSVASCGWTVTANGEQGIISIEHDSLGIVLKDMRLNINDGQGLTALKGWSAEKSNNCWKY